MGAGRLVAIAVVIALVCMGGLTARAVVSSGSCNSQPVVLNVSVSTDLAPAVAAVANSFNKQRATAAGRCVQVQVSPASAASEAQVLEGRAAAPGAPADAWIPDSSLWVDAARGYAGGAQAIRSVGASVARSPVMLVTTQKIAAATGVFAMPASWNLLVPAAYGGPPAKMGLSVDLPDPDSSATGLAALIEVSRALSASPSARAAVTSFVLTAQHTESFNSASALAQFAQTTRAPLSRTAMTVASEQAVLAYDKANPSSPLAARYATSADKTLGTPELDYPYVLTAASSARRQAAGVFGSYLHTGYAQSLLRYHGFRSAGGVPDVMPAAAGLASQPLQVASTASATEVASSIKVFQALGPSFRELSLVDTSPAMNQPSGTAGLTNLQLVSKVADEGLPFYPDDAQFGLWVTGNTASASPAYSTLMPIGPLSAPYSLIVRRTAIQQIAANLQPSANGKLALYSAILAAYKEMTKTFNPKTSNTVMVFTSGADTAPNDISLKSLLAQLRKLYNPERQVSVFILLFGNQGNIAQLKQISDVTEGIATKITSTAQIANLFFQGVSTRTCGQDCGSQ